MNKQKFNLNNIGWITRSEIALFTKNLATMLKGNLTIIDALDISQAQAKGKFKVILQEVIAQIKNGHSLSDGLKKYERNFSPSYIDVIQTGEISGNLAPNLEHLAVQLEKDLDMRRKIRTAMVYPTFILASTFLLGIVLASFVLPRLGRLFTSLEMTLPPSTRFLLFIASFVADHGFWVVVATGLGIIGFRYFVKLNFVKPVTHGILLAIPFINKISRQLNLARVTRGLGSLLKSGLPITEALKALMASLENVYYRKALTSILADIEAGNSLSSALAKHHKLFPDMVHRMVQASEKSGQLDTSLLYLARHYEAEVDNAAKNLSVVIEPALLIIIGGVVGFIGLSIITPIYQMTGRIGQ